MRAVEIVSNLYKAYADRDIEGALAQCSEDVVFRWIADPRQSRHAGTAHGKQEFLSRLLGLHDDFEYRHFAPVDIIDGGDRVAAQVEIHMTCRATGEKFVMRTANFWTVHDGQIIEMVEYYDTALAASVL